MTPDTADELTSMTACEAVQRLKSGEVSSADLIEAAFQRIEATDDAVNAMVIHCRDRAERQAASAAKETPLAGLPVGIKDLSDLAGVRCTQGSPIYENQISETSAISVERLEAAGAIPIGKTNTPEFGAGANTFNAVFGITRNPWDTSKSCAGSSGGSAVALATGQCWLATGSDLGGSLRTPASFCGVVGLRPSPGRVPRKSLKDPFNTMSVEGPMGRTVEDTALMLDCMAGWDARDPISFPARPGEFLETSRNTPAPKRIAYSLDLGGIIPVDPAVADVFGEALKTLEDMGVELVETCPDFTHTIETFNVIRGLGFVSSMAFEYENHRDQLKDDVIWNIELGQSLNADQIARAFKHRAEMYDSATRLLRDGGFDAFLCPTAIVPPYPAEKLWVDEVNGQHFDNYIHWLAMVSAITLTSLPSVSVPAGFTANHLPVGVQFVGHPRAEGTLLGHARHFEQANGLTAQLPIMPRNPA